MRMQVTIMGHSAGAHLCAMAILMRIPGVRQMLPQKQGEWNDARMPATYIGVRLGTDNQRPMLM